MACHCREGDLLQVLRSLIPLTGLVGGQGRGRGETPSQHLGIAYPSDECTGSLGKPLSSPGEVVEWIFGTLLHLTL